MKKRYIFSIILLFIFIGMMFLGYGGNIVFWLFTPKKEELRAEETDLFEKIKKQTQAQKVWREPVYSTFDSKDTVTYRIVVYKPDCNEKKYGSLQILADQIKQEIDSMHLSKNFYQYEILYECKISKNIRFIYLR